MLDSFKVTLLHACGSNHGLHQPPYRFGTMCAASHVRPDELVVVTRHTRFAPHLSHVIIDFYATLRGLFLLMALPPVASARAP